jgi:hypothetical protein
MENRWNIKIPVATIEDTLFPEIVNTAKIDNKIIVDIIVGMIGIK